MASRATNTQAEGLQKMLSDISAMKTTPDANLQFLVALETAIIGQIRAPMEQAMGNLQAASGQPGMVAAGGAPQMGPPQPSAPMPMQGPGPAAGPSMGDELRRLIG